VEHQGERSFGPDSRRYQGRRCGAGSPGQDAVPGGRPGPRLLGGRQRDPRGVGSMKFAAILSSVAALSLIMLPAAAQEAARVDHARLLAADAEAGQWMSTGRTYDEQRFSPLTQINAQTVNRLGLAWYADIETERGLE